jgi:hypothetical protein
MSEEQSQTPVRQKREAKPAVAEEAVSIDEGAKRIDEIRARRAERGPPTAHMRQRLSIEESKKDPRFEYRWALDSGNRVHDLKAKDWDIAPGETTEGDARDIGVGSVPERIGNAKTVVKPERHILMRKPKEFYIEDKTREMARLKEQEEALRKGDVKNPQGLSGPGAYIPAGGMKIEQGR